MAKLNLETIRREVITAKAFPFADPRSAEPLTLWLKPLDVPMSDAATALAREWVSKYITGGFFNESIDQWVKEPMVFPEIDGAKVEVSPEFFGMIADLVMMQDPPDAGDKYSFYELIEVSVKLPDAFRAAVKKANSLLKGENPGKGEGTGSSTATPA